MDLGLWLEGGDFAVQEAGVDPVEPGRVGFLCFRSNCKVGVGGLVDLPEFQIVEKGFPFLEPMALKNVIDRPGPIIEVVNHIEISPNDDDFPRIQQGLQCIQLKHPKGLVVARREVEVGTGERGPRDPRDVFRIEIEDKCPTREAGIRGDLNNIEARRELAVDQGNDPGPPLLKIVVVDQVSLAELSIKGPVFP